MKYLFGFIASLFLFFAVFCSCGTGDISRQFTKSQAVRLISADSQKTWSRNFQLVNGVSSILDDCELDNTLVFTVSTSDSTLYQIGKLSGCDINAEPDTLLTANWSLTEGIESIATDTLVLSSLDGSALNPFIISVLSARNFTIQYVDDAANIVTEGYTF